MNVTSKSQQINFDLYIRREQIAFIVIKYDFDNREITQIDKIL